VPTKAAHGLGATFVVAVDPGFAVKTYRIDNVLKAFIQGVQIMGEELNAYQAKRADVVIKPELRNIDQFDFEQSPVIIEQGSIATEKKMKSLKRKLFFFCWKR
jgi:hypothetical protein